MRCPRRLALPWTALALVLAACGAEPGTALEGSLTSRFDLGFDRARALLVGGDLAIQYVRDVPGGALVPFELVAEDVPADAASGAESASIEIGTEALSVGRVMGAGDPETLPGLEFGRLVLARPVAVGEALDGSFDLRFTDGSDLSGRFEAVVEGP